MNLDQAIKKIINDHGTDILKDRRLVSMLADLQAFGQLPYAANMLRQIYANGYGVKIHQLYCSQDQTEVAAFLSELRNKLGFDVEMLGKVLYAFSLPMQRAGKQKQGGNSQGVTSQEQRMFSDLQVFEYNDGTKTYVDKYGGIYCYPNAEKFNSLENINIHNYTIRKGTKIITDGAFVIPPDEWTEVFVNQSSIRKVIIPDTVVEIEANPFRGCRYLRQIVVNNTKFKVINDMLINFDSNRLLAYFGNGNRAHIPCWVNTIAEDAFSFNVSLKHVDFNEVVCIEEFAFHDCLSLECISVPSSVKEIGAYAFAGCKSIREIYIPDSITSIEDGVFSGCSSLTDISIPNTITSIGVRAFEDCESFYEITIPNSVTNIGKYAFNGCKSLRTIYLPQIFSNQSHKYLEDNIGINSYCSVYTTY